MRWPETVAVLAALMSDGDVARFVGGCVRDAVAKRPVQDVDIAATGAPEKNIRLLEDAGVRVIPTGLSHGTVTAISNRRQFEVTTLRRDVETFGRHARIAFTDDWVEDARRRDFTINALYADADGKLFDPTGGLADLTRGRVRFVGRAATRIAEDRLRILRFFRFHAWFGRGRANRAALLACAAAAAGIRLLSGERIRQELFKLLSAPEPRPALRLMLRHGVLMQILPADADFPALSRLMRGQDDGSPDGILRLAALLRGRDAAYGARLAERLRLANAARDRLLFLLASPISLKGQMPVAQIRRAAYLHGREPMMDLARLKGASTVVEQFRNVEIAEFPLKGRDALAVGLAPGPEVGALLAAIEIWWIEGDFKADRAACLARLETLAAAPRHSG